MAPGMEAVSGALRNGPSSGPKMRKDQREREAATVGATDAISLANLVPSLRPRSFKPTEPSSDDISYFVIYGTCN